MRKIYAIIPARYASSRFPGKPLALINGVPMIQWVYSTLSKIELLDNVYVATDNRMIYDVVKSFNGNVLMTSEKHQCGSERIAECIDILNISSNDIILNIQGDEPLIKEEEILDLLDCFKNDEVYMGTLKKLITDPKEISNPNVVKVVTDIYQYALMFSRNPLPCYRSYNSQLKYFKHIGIYGYSAEFLLKYSSLGQTPLENAESLEQLRVLEHGYKIKVLETQCQTIGVDSPDDIVKIEEILSKINNVSKKGEI